MAYMPQYPYPNPHTPYHSSEDRSRLLSINEETVFLQNGVLRAQDLVPKTTNDLLLSTQEPAANLSQLEELLTIGANDTQELGQRIIQLSTIKVKEIGRHHRYQFQVLKAVWKYKYERALEQKAENDAQALIESEELDRALDPTSGKNLGFKLNLCLLIPILQSYSETNPEVALSTVQLLFEELSRVPVMSLENESSTSMQKLENLLCHWITTNGQTFQMAGSSALVALSCARGHLASLLKMVCVLKTCPNLKEKLPVAPILDRLEEYGKQLAKPCALDGDRHILTWPLDPDLKATAISADKELGTFNYINDLLNLTLPGENAGNGTNNASADIGGQSSNKASTSPKKESEDLAARCYVATDGTFLYVTGPKGKGLSKVGTGFHGTLRGQVYFKNIDVDCGFIAAVKAGLVSRPLDTDAYDQTVNGKRVLGVLVDRLTLKPERLILISDPNEDIPRPFITIGLTSDGESLYHVRSELPVGPSANLHDLGSLKLLTLYLDVYKLEVPTEVDEHVNAVPIGRRISIHKYEEVIHSSSTSGMDRNEEHRPTPRSGGPANVQALQLQCANAAATATSENYMSSLGVYYRQLAQSVVITCGNYLTFIMPNYWVPIFSPSMTPPPPPGNPCNVNNGVKMYAPIMSQHCSRTIGTQIHVGLSDPPTTFHKQELTNMPVNSSFYNGALLQQMSGTYDPTHNFIWTTNGDYVDMWNNPGHLPNWKQNELMLYVPAEDAISSGGSEIEISQTICITMRHISRMGVHFLSGDKLGSDIGFGPNVLESVLELVLRYLRQFNHVELKSIFTLLKVVIGELNSVQEGSELFENLSQVQSVLFCFISDAVTTEKFSHLKTVYRDAGELFAMLFDFLYKSTESRNTFLTELHAFMDEEAESELSPGQTYHNSDILRQELLKHFIAKLDDPGLKFEDGIKWILEEPWLTRVLRDAVREVDVLFSLITKQIQEGDDSNLTYSANFPVSVEFNLQLSPYETNYIKSLVNFILRSWVLCEDKIPEALRLLGIDTFKSILNYGCMTVERGVEFVSTQEHLSLRNYANCEGILKASTLGLAIPQILAFLVSSEQNVKELEDGLLEECIQLTVAISHLSGKLNRRQSWDLGEDWSSKIKVPAPWAHKKVIESIHPLRETVKIKETVVVPEARQLFLKFNPQCATQYDYDKLFIYQGCGPNQKKVAECGGNYYGCGNRNFSGPGWPRDLIRIDGNVVTYSFDTRSTRETATSDRAVFGYLFTIYPSLDYSDPDKPEPDSMDPPIMIPVNNGLVTVLSLHCIDVVQKVVVQLLLGDPESKEEIDSRPILMNGLASRLRWHNHKAVKLAGIRKKFSHEIISKLKKNAGVANLQIRQNLSEKIKLADFEDVYLQCCLKHLGPNPFLSEEAITQNAESLNNSQGLELIRKMFRSIEMIVRQLMAFSEMEKMLIQDIDDVGKKLKTLDEAFFYDPEFLESSSNMTILAMICDLEYDKDAPANLLNDVTAMMQAFIEDGTTPELTKLTELIEETHSKCQYLLNADKRAEIELTDLSFDEALHLLNYIHNFAFSHFLNAKTTVRKFYEAMTRTQARAVSRVEAFDILLKVLQCSQPNSALLTVAGIMLLDGPDLESVACSGLEKDVLSRYGDALKAVIDMAQRDPLLHRFTVSLLCVIRYNRTDEMNLVESGLLSILDQLCAYQMHDSQVACVPAGSNTLPVQEPVQMSKEIASVHVKVSTLAWAAFRVLASRCASWEKTEIQPVSNCFAYSPSNALPIQISANVTNHLARAANLAAISNADSREAGISLDKLSCAPSLTDAIQDVLGLLNTLQEYKIGRAILKQSPCICRLLSLLQDPRLSPRLVLIILKLLNTALPLVDNLETTNISTIITAKKNPQSTSSNTSSSGSPIQYSPHHQVASMLLAKLADFLVCGSQHSPKVEPTSQQVCSLETTSDAVGLLDPQYPQLCVWIQKRTDQLAAPMLRQIFLDNSRSDLRPSRASINQLETELNADGRVLLYTEDSAVAQRKAMRLGQLGCIVSLEPPSSNASENRPGKVEPQTKSAETICKEKNSNLASWDPPRPFISGQVAECLASEIVQLLRVLLNSSKQSPKAVSTTSSKASVQATNSANSIIQVESNSEFPQDLVSDIASHLNQRSIWSTAVEQVLCLSLKSLPKLVNVGNPTNVPLESFAFSARLAIASLTVLGAFTESIRSGSDVWIINEKEELLKDDSIQSYLEHWSFKPLRGRVLDISESTGSAQVEVSSEDNPSSKKSYNIPLSRLVPCHNQKFGTAELPNLSKSAETEIGNYLKALLFPNTPSSSSTPKQDTFALKRELPSLGHIVTAAGIKSGLSLTSTTGRVSESRAIAHGMTVVRMVAEIRTRCMQVLSQWLRNREFLDCFLGQGSQASLDTRTEDVATLSWMRSLKSLAKDCKPSHRINSVETQVATMRLLYRDCTRPPRLASSAEKCACLEVNWNTTKTFPKVKNCVVSTSTNSVVYLGDYNAVGGQPRGLLLYANHGVSAEGFYWEATIVSAEDVSQVSDTGLTSPSVLIGLAPEAVPPEQRSSEGWKYPSGSTLLTIGGRIQHYKSQDCLTTRIEGDVKIKVGDTIGIGWERAVHDSILPPLSRETPRSNTSVPPPPPPPPNSTMSYSRRVRIRNSNGTIPTGRTMIQLDNSAFGPKGHVFFTLNGKKLPNIIQQTNCGLLPVLHLQKRGIIVSANFETRPFAYTDAKKNSPVAPTAPGRGVLNTSEGSGSSESGLLLRRVSDSLQDLNMELNFGAFTMDGVDSNSDLEIQAQSESDDAISSNASSELMALAMMEEAEEGEVDLMADDDSSVGIINPITPGSDRTVSSDNFENERRQHRTTIGQTQVIPTLIPGPFFNTEDLQNSRTPASRPEPTTRPKDPPEHPGKSDLIAKPHQKSSEYNPLISLDYFLEPSPTNGIKVFSGPNKNLCSCSANSPTLLDVLMLETQSSEDKKGDNSASARQQRAEDIEADLDSSDEEEDAHSQLVRAWEQQVFPVIRRRFRNESERRDGLEQIRGALQLGMIEIARQTVEFLYEEGGTLPRDLHFPTMEEVRAEGTRCTMERVRPGSTVLIRPLLKLTDSSSVLPAYAVPAMLRTFGLIGEVLELDVGQELVLVETYVESEGILLRFWYPVAGLDKPQTCRKPSLNANTVNMFKLHSNLLTLESSLCHMYSRSSYLEILNSMNEDVTDEVEANRSESNASNVSSKISPVPNDLENLQILSDHSLAAFPLNGNLLTRNLTYGCPSIRFLKELGNPLAVIYKDTGKLTQEIKGLLTKAGVQGDACLKDLTSQFLSVIDLAPEKFPSFEAVADKITDVNIQVPDAAFTLLCVKGLQPPKYAANSVDTVTHSCIHLSCYDSGEVQRHPLVCYPVHSMFPADLTDSLTTSRVQRSQTAVQTARKTLQIHRRKFRFPPILVPTDKVHFSVTETSLKGLTVHIQGIPSQFPLALIYFKSLVEFVRENANLSLDVIVFAASKLVNFLCITTMPPLIKEWVVSLITEAITLKRDGERFPTDFALFRPNLADRIFAEMLFIFEKESELVSNAQSYIVNNVSEHFTCGTKSNVKDTSGQGMTSTRPTKSHTTGESSKGTISNVHEAVDLFFEQNKAKGLRQSCCFSGYLQSLIELCLTMNNMYTLTFNPLEMVGDLPVVSPCMTPSRKQSGQAVVSAPSSSQSKGRRIVGGVMNKKSSNVPRPLDLKKERMAKSKHQPTPAISGPVERPSSAKHQPSPPTPVPEVSVHDGYKSHDFEWFRLAENSILALRNLVWNDSANECIQAMNDVITLACENISTSTTHERLVVVYGAPTNLSGMSVETSLLRALKDCGGIFGNEMWVSRNMAVVEMRCGFKVSQALEVLKQNKSWYPIDDFLLYPSVNAYRVSSSFKTGDAFGDNTLTAFLRWKVSDPSDNDKLCIKAEEALSAIFMSCCVTTEFLAEDEFGTILLNNVQLSAKISGNLMERFMGAVKPETYTLSNFTKEIVTKFGERRKTDESLIVEGNSSKSGISNTYSQDQVSVNDSAPQEDVREGPSKAKFQIDSDNQLGLSQNGFIHWCTQLAKDNVQGLWAGIVATGYDLRFERAWPFDCTSSTISQFFATQWTRVKDAALAAFIDSSAVQLRIGTAKMHPHEVYLTEADLSNPTYKKLQGTPVEYLRVRASVLQALHRCLVSDLLPYIGLHKYAYLKRSIAALCHEAKYMVFYDTKEFHLFKLLHATCLRGMDSSTPELFLDPVLALDTTGPSETTLVHQAIPQLRTLSSALYCTSPLGGSDPSLPISIKYQGEEVLGLSGSYRHFMLNISKEIQRESFNVFCKCPSSDAGRNKDSLVFHPGSISYTEEEVLYFLGQMMGVAIRSDVTMPFSLLKPTWRSMLLSEKEINDHSDDLIETDVLCATYIKNIQSIRSSNEFDNFLSLYGWPKFQYPSIDKTSDPIPLCPGGKDLSVSYSNKDQFVNLIRKFREKELRSENRVNRILAGLATIIPLPALLNLFTTSHLEFRVCSSPEIDLALLKAHTHYQVGVSETDPHILYFWSALESFTPEELRKFVKFACNLERLPASCPCQSSTGEHQGHVLHVSPFPMKIAPIDIPANMSIEEVDRRLLRVETCLFLIRLPPYSSLQVTRQQLLYAINCRDDPLSG